MSRRPPVSYREPTTPNIVQSGVPDWVPSTIVFAIGMVFFAVVELLIH